MREFDLLSRIYASNAHLTERVAVPPGDDLAMVRLDGRNLLAGVDQLVAGRHVRLETTPLELVGRKAVTRSLSDIAAMAGRPVATLAAAVLPPNFREERAMELFEAMRVTAASYRCPLIGGDIAMHADDAHPLTLSVTVLAEPVGDRPITRSGAVAGDGLYVTGSLGGAVEPDGGGLHLTFEPRIDEAIELAEALGDRLHAMIDLSDGLGRDASHIAESSNVTIEIEAERIPCAAGVDWRSAMSGGEDYELLFAASGDVPATLGDGVPVRSIGRIVPRASAGGPLVRVSRGGSTFDGAELGWQHEGRE
jgi:thiamine-monophosphate kinase